ncbi:MAG: DUF2804 domain-containing protein, partial [Deltaproteobacteria bacterium]|nr:DUF2804 domain-containing protein [Deltaproteobacteria bacterium]
EENEMKLREETSLISPQGRPLFGIYKKPPADLSLDAFRPYGSSGCRVCEGFIKSCRIKRWQYLGACSDEVVFGLAIVSLGYLSNMFAYVYDRSRRSFSEWNVIHPLGMGTFFEGSSMKGQVRFAKGNSSVVMRNETDSMALSASWGKELSAELHFGRYRESLNSVTRVGLSGFNYTTKEAGLPVEGTITVKGRTFTIKKENASGVLDYTLGHLARHTFWNWASGGGFDTSGKRLGFNLVQGVNETGYTENVFWVDGRMIKTDTIDFSYDDLNILSQWQLTSSDGKVNLVFYPEGERKMDLNLGVILSKFHQPFGRFEGHFSDGTTTWQVGKVFGFTEEHASKW